MAYFEQHGAMHGWLGHPAAPVLQFVCDQCAETIVPFKGPKGTFGRHFDTGWHSS